MKTTNMMLMAVAALIGTQHARPLSLIQHHINSRSELSQTATPVVGDTKSFDELNVGEPKATVDGIDPLSGTPSNSASCGGASSTCGCANACEGPSGGCVGIPAMITCSDGSKPRCTGDPQITCATGTIVATPPCCNSSCEKCKGTLGTVTCKLGNPVLC